MLTFKQVVAAWTHPRLRGHKLAMELYTELFLQLGALTPAVKRMKVDVKFGAYERIIKSARVFRMLHQTGLDIKIVPQRKKSYTVQLSGGAFEQFESLTCNVRPVAWCLQAQQKAIEVWGRWEPVLTRWRVLERAQSFYLYLERSPTFSTPLKFMVLLCDRSIRLNVTVFTSMVPLILVAIRVRPNYHSSDHQFNPLM